MLAAVQNLDDPEGPHQLRVGLRRLRSTFFSTVLASPELTRLNEEARWLSQEVGLLRDLDVVANDIVRREAAAHVDEPGLLALANALSCEAGERRRHLRSCLTTARAQAFLIDLVRFVETRGWLMAEDFGQTPRLATPVLALADRALNKRWRKVCSHGRKLETLNANERHELRKQLKKLRYAVEFFSALFPAKRVEPFAKCLRRLQTVFGDLNDAATAKAMLAETRFRSSGEPQVQRTIGWVIGASQARAESSWAGAKGLWRNLEQTRPFWK
jgi:triphosphatase